MFACANMTKSPRITSEAAMTFLEVRTIIYYYTFFTQRTDKASER